MRVPYYCPYCNQRSTRRWNLDVHIKRRHGGYLLGESLDRYIGSSTPNNLYRNIGSATVADSVGNTFEPGYLRQQAPLGISRYSPSAIYLPLPTIDEQSYGGGLSQDVTQKIQELKRLLNKYHQYHQNSDAIIWWAVHGAVKGDNTFLDEKLKQLVSLDFYNP